MKAIKKELTSSTAQNEVEALKKMGFSRNRPVRMRNLNTQFQASFKPTITISDAFGNLFSDYERLLQFVAAKVYNNPGERLCARIHQNVLDLDKWLKSQDSVKSTDNDLIRKALSQIALYLSQYAMCVNRFDIAMEISRFISSDYDRSIALGIGLFGEGEIYPGMKVLVREDKLLKSQKIVRECAHEYLRKFLDSNLKQRVSALLLQQSTRIASLDYSGNPLPSLKALSETKQTQLTTSCLEQYSEIVLTWVRFKEFSDKFPEKQNELLFLLSTIHKHSRQAQISFQNRAYGKAELRYYLAMTCIQQILSRSSYFSPEFRSLLDRSSSPQLDGSDIIPYLHSLMAHCFVNLASCKVHRAVQINPVLKTKLSALKTSDLPSDFFQCLQFLSDLPGESSFAYANLFHPLSSSAPGTSTSASPTTSYSGRLLKYSFLMEKQNRRSECKTVLSSLLQQSDERMKNLKISEDMKEKWCEEIRLEGGKDSSSSGTDKKKQRTQWIVEGEEDCEHKKEFIRNLLLKRSLRKFL